MKNYFKLIIFILFTDTLHNKRIYFIHNTIFKKLMMHFLLNFEKL